MSFLRSNNQAFSYLESLGYHAVRLPKTGIKPLQLYQENDGKLTKLGDLKELFDSSIADKSLPALKKNELAANVSRERSSKMELSVGFSLLKSLLAAFGGGSLGIDSKYNNVRSLSLQYNDVLEDSITTLAADKFMLENQAHISCSENLMEALEDEKVHLITSVLKSQKFTIIPECSQGATMIVSIPEIQGIVGGKVTVDYESKDKLNISYTGQKKLVFGFKSMVLSFEDGQYIGPNKKKRFPKPTQMEMMKK